MNERDYLRLKRKFAKEYEGKLRALELIWQEVSGGKKPPKERKDQPEENGTTAAARGNSAAAVAEFVGQWKGDRFSAKQVESWIAETKGFAAHRTTIIHKLRRMLNDNELTLVSQGSGKRASQYSIANHMAPEQTPPEVVTTEEPSAPEPEIEPEYEPAMATQEDVNQLRDALSFHGTILSQFRATVLNGEFGVQKASELTHDQIQQLIERYAPPPPNDDIPF